MFTRDAPTTTAAHAAPLGWWGRRSRLSRVFAVTLAGFMLLTVGYLGVRSLLGGDPETAAKAPATAAPAAKPQPSLAPLPPPKAAPAKPSAPQKSCGGFPEPTGAPNLFAPKGTEWALVAGMAAPQSKADGPAFTDPVRWCYSHTPAGSLYAVVNYLAQMAAADATPASEALLAQHAMADTAARESFLAIWNQVKTPRASEQPDVGAGGSVHPQVLGFHFIAFNPDLAVVDLAYSSGGALYGTTYTVRWQGGDWKFDPPADGQFPVRDLSSLDPTYFTVWSPE